MDRSEADDLDEPILVHLDDLDRFFDHIQKHSRILPDGNLEVHYPDGATEAWHPITGDFVPDPSVDCGFAWLEWGGRYWRLDLDDDQADT